MVPEKSDTLTIAQHTKIVWYRSSIMWRIVDYALAILSFTASIAVVFVEIMIKENQIWILVLSVLAATLTLISFAVNPKKHMQSYRMAWIELNKALLQYDENKQSESNQKLIDSILRGEKIINNTYE